MSDEHAGAAAVPAGMSPGMTEVERKAKIAISIRADLLEQVHATVADGDAPSVSAFIERSVANQLQIDAELGALLDSALDGTGGPVTDEERSWADRVLGLKP